MHVRLRSGSLRFAEVAAFHRSAFTEGVQWNSCLAAIGLVLALALRLSGALQPHLPASLLQVGLVPLSMFSALSSHWLAFETMWVATCCAGFWAATLEPLWVFGPFHRQSDASILRTLSNLFAVIPKTTAPPAKPAPLLASSLTTTPFHSRRAYPRYHHHHHLSVQTISLPDDTNAIGKHSPTN